MRRRRNWNSIITTRLITELFAVNSRLITVFIHLFVCIEIGRFSAMKRTRQKVLLIMRSIGWFLGGKTTLALENRLYPTWQQLEEQNNPLTAGEKALLKYLDTYLPKDTQWKSGDKLENYKGWLIFAQPFLNGTRPDIIIFNPQVGLVIYEVKDWNLDNYEWKKGEGLFVNDGRGSYPVKSPIDQVEHYKEKLIGQLVPSIGEAIDQN